MPRPKHPRTIHAPPGVDGFKPRGAGQNKEIILSVEEFEAIRLVDFEGLDQTRGAALMGISRQTFGRVLKSGRFILSKALVKGLHLKVEGGCYKIRGNRHGKGNGRGKQRHQKGAIDPITPQATSSGGNVMVENNKAKGQKNTTSPRGSGAGQGTGQGRGTGQGMGRGRGVGGGKGDGSCRRRDGGMGRGLGGGKRDGSRGGK
ncbi:Predicted DNA-binding protein, UPF0251 family [Desulfocicer vacuolatum DSM 3385]|uniref:UPF0251 protein SAMN02746065_12816 n=1 Tax=Desulfocicer vacuolatum DSM 3385 TaxID=1121400 RepID=A0A1W2EBH1_9BACT|nr:DUF134 domain-containing protein [Desulfocicer vacuolatum]SMD07015.1 Predicted DNA-binding protein, UPF0251 family [Desulfocicer vacuolatum DSM 3385]